MGLLRVIIPLFQPIGALIALTSYV